MVITEWGGDKRVGKMRKGWCRIKGDQSGDKGRGGDDRRVGVVRGDWACDSGERAVMDVSVMIRERSL